ncbi:aminomethyl-transferring glycine dehydrogenase subunit GcvPA [Desulfoluna spongiiphila]|uniref:Probable glycine dehydrogenase (decarboxylating) subunit 1 n=1 Tax=Desulfoluna spongiiphila TaxID=419481 RepID=A0A1G5H502_9BACT|nr:aminomethyl-transferring glycine dehydrogenase subunit GcvPA [Desulfoluna spongiiphila]SCY58741.1 glycine dehydrogenase (decarboxylating) alpha subunit [Desulfoluna spongiiphila]
MRYLPHTPEDIHEMLKVIGVDTVDDLFHTIPDACRNSTPMDLPPAMSEWDLNAHMDSLAATMASSNEYRVFIGAGSYNHHIPSSVPYLLSRSEFATAYTPYQPEISQGTLQGIYEFQTLVTRLLGMDVATASHYDGATGLSEALLMAVKKTKRKKVAVSVLCHPFHREVIRTYMDPAGVEVVEVPYTPEGRTDLKALEAMDDLAAVAVQSPNFFGVVEDLKGFSDTIHAKKGVMIGSFTEAIAWGLMKNPGRQGVDIVAGDGQSLGIPKAFGGPGLGLLASTKAHMRQLPGRLVGATTDLDGKRGFVLTLAAREQHIRREKATSNICSNNGLCALNAAMYMASLGGSGFRRLAQINHNKAEYLKKALAGAGVEITFASPTFNEFVVKFPKGFEATYERLLAKMVVAGLPLERFYPELQGHYLLCVTETLSKTDLDQLVKEVTA